MRSPFRFAPLVLAAAALLSLVTPRGGQGVPLYASRMGLQCGACHFDPNGGGPRTEFGFNFAKNRHALEAESGERPWGELNLVNRVSDALPLYVGLNHRFMLLTNKYEGRDSVARLGFYNMENNLHFAFQPHTKLTLVYSLDAFSSATAAGSFRSKEAFAKLDLGAGAYLKAGRFRPPFGLRLDDHTVATRRGFLDFSSDQSFLPYDPRQPDMGVELGAERGGMFGRAAFTNGNNELFAGQYAGAKTVKLGYNHPYYQGAVSFYDDERKEGFSGLKRASRWGYYGLTHAGPVSLIGEYAMGTDEAEPALPGFASGAKTNLTAWFAEIDVAPVRQWNVRLRYDRDVYDRSSDPLARDASTHTRLALETEYVPVPFCELRWTLRSIRHEDPAAFGYPNETQSYLQLHLSY